MLDCLETSKTPLDDSVARSPLLGIGVEKEAINNFFDELGDAKPRARWPYVMPVCYILTGFLFGLVVAIFFMRYNSTDMLASRTVSIGSSVKLEGGYNDTFEAASVTRSTNSTIVGGSNSSNKFYPSTFLEELRKDCKNDSSKHTMILLIGV